MKYFMRIIENQPINTAVWFLDSDVTGRHKRLIDSDVSLGSERPEETAELQARRRRKCPRRLLHEGGLSGPK